MKKIFLIWLIVLGGFVSAFTKGKSLAIVYPDRFDNYVNQYKMWKSLLGFDVTLKDVDDFSPKDSSSIYNWLHGSGSSNWPYPGDDNFYV